MIIHVGKQYCTSEFWVSFWIDQLSSGKWGSLIESSKVLVQHVQKPFPQKFLSGQEVHWVSSETRSGDIVMECNCRLILRCNVELCHSRPWLLFHDRYREASQYYPRYKQPIHGTQTHMRQHTPAGTPILVPTRGQIEAMKKPTPIGRPKEAKDKPAHQASYESPLPKQPLKVEQVCYRHLEKTERIIALKKNRLGLHEKKWQALRS